jgi:hypothetical protein
MSASAINGLMSGLNCIEDKKKRITDACNNEDEQEYMKN